MSRFQTYYLIGKVLSVNFHPAEKDEIRQRFLMPNFNWNSFIAMASNHLVLQTLFVKLQNHDLLKYLPKKIKEHLAYIHQLNYERNTCILSQVKEINTLLNQNGIIPLYLKGVGNILDGLYDSIGERIMHDIDILVPDNQWEETANLLRMDGYTFINHIETNIELKQKHFPPLVKTGCKASVEVHRISVSLPYEKMLDTETVWKEKKLIDNGHKCYVMSNSHNIVHNFIHSQLAHNGHRFARVSYRNMYDLLLLSKRENVYPTLSGMRLYQKQVGGYLRIIQKSFSVQIVKKNILKNKGVVFAFRHQLNLRSRSLSIFTFYFSSMVKAFVFIPLKSLTNRELFISLIKRILNRNWYRSHFTNYSRIYIKNVH